MAHAVTIGLDIAKSVFQVHGVDATGEVVIRRQVRRAQMLVFFAKLSLPVRRRSVRQRLHIDPSLVASQHLKFARLDKAGHEFVARKAYRFSFVGNA